jgi:hypothetical protein
MEQDEEVRFGGSTSSDDPAFVFKTKDLLDTINRVKVVVNGE